MNKIIVKIDGYVQTLFTCLEKNQVYKNEEERKIAYNDQPIRNTKYKIQIFKV